jgi:hypothetical protein
VFHNLVNQKSEIKTSSGARGITALNQLPKSLLKKLVTLPWVLLTVPISYFVFFAVNESIPVNYLVTIEPVGNRDQAFEEGCQLRAQAESKLGEISLFEYGALESDGPVQTSAVTWKEVMRGSPETYCVGTLNFTLKKGVGYIFYSGEPTPATVDPWEVRNGNLRWELNYEITQRATIALDIVALSDPCNSNWTQLVWCSTTAGVAIDEPTQTCSGLGKLSSLDFNKPIILQGQKTGLTYQPLIPSGRSWETQSSDPLMGGEPTLTCHVVVEGDIPYDPDGYVLEVKGWGSLEYTTQELESNGWLIALRNTESQVVKN